jgi:hypothetical protein
LVAPSGGNGPAMMSASPPPRGPRPTEDDIELASGECAATGHWLLTHCTPWYLLLFSLAITPGISIGSWILRVNAADGGADGATRYRMAYAISGYCAILAVLVSLWTVWQHLLNYTNPRLQQKIIRIVLMVPIYAVHSWVALRFRSWAVYLNLFRDSYESFVVYQFFSLLVAYLGGDELCALRLVREPPMRALFPASLVARRPFQPGPLFLRRIYICIMQYVLLKPLLALLAMVLTPLGMYREGSIDDPANAYLYFTLIATTSVAAAVFALLHFYVATASLLAGVNPLGMLLAVKVILFASFWQSVVVAVCVHLHIIVRTRGHSAAQVATGIQDFLICVEMLFVALAFRVVFSYRPFVARHYDSERWTRKLRMPSRKEVASAQHSLDPRGMVGDAYHDVTRLLGGHLKEDFLDRFLVDGDPEESMYTELSVHEATMPNPCAGSRASSSMTPEPLS